MIVPIKIIIADDSKWVIEFVSLALEKNISKFTIVGIAKDGGELINMVKLIQPDVILLDLKLPIIHGLEVLKIFKTDFPDIKTIIFGDEYSDFVANEIVMRGARAYLSNNEDSAKILSTIVQVYKNEYAFEEPIFKKVLLTIMQEDEKMYLIDDIKYTEREILILREICRDKTAKEIADKFNTTTHTIDKDKQSLKEKTKTNTLGALIAFAYKQKIIREDEM